MSESEPILTATDFSRFADMAVRRAARLAAEQRRVLELITVISRTRMDVLRELIGLDSGGVELQLIENARARLQALAAEIAHEHGCEVRTHVRSGSACAEILEHARETQAKLIVVGKHGDRGLVGGLLGGTAAKVLRHAVRPVLLVRRATSRPYQAVVVATDFSSACQGALRLTAQLAPRAHLHVINALDPPFEMKLVSAGVPTQVISEYQERYKAQARQAMQEYLRTESHGISGSLSMALAPGEPARVIQEQAVSQRADLIVVGRSGQSLITDLLLRSVSAAVAEEAQADVLVLHGTEA